MKRETEYLPWTLIIDDSLESAQAHEFLVRNQIPIFVQRIGILPSGFPEIKVPILITSISSFRGFSRIVHFTSSFHQTVCEYLDAPL